MNAGEALTLMQQANSVEGVIKRVYEHIKAQATHGMGKVTIQIPPKHIEEFTSRMKHDGYLHAQPDKDRNPGKWEIKWAE